MRSFRVGRFAVPLWLVAVLLISLFGAVLGLVVWTLNVEMEVKEPVNVLYYPCQLSLYPGETVDLDVDLWNEASVNYSVKLGFHLNDSVYQLGYVTFSNQTYIVVPGKQILMAWKRR